MGRLNQAAKTMFHLLVPGFAAFWCCSRPCIPSQSLCASAWCCPTTSEWLSSWWLWVDNARYLGPKWKSKKEHDDKSIDWYRGIRFSDNPTFSVILWETNIHFHPFSSYFVNRSNSVTHGRVGFQEMGFMLGQDSQKRGPTQTQRPA
jgi:hypothetical protein